MEGYIRLDRRSHALALLQDFCRNYKLGGLDDLAMISAITSLHGALQGYLTIALLNGNGFDTWKKNDRKTWLKQNVSFSDNPVAFMTFTERQSNTFNKLRDQDRNIRPSLFYALEQVIYLKQRTKLNFIQMIREIQSSGTYRSPFKLSISRHFSTLMLLKYLTNYRLDCYTFAMLHANYLKNSEIDFVYCIGATTITPHIHTWIEVNSSPFLDTSTSSYTKIIEIPFYGKSA
tara:strand:- start:646 stop:1341 length:696 start_codon:yes stop_codon:yes gene_type:complete